MSSANLSDTIELPLIPLRDVVIYPHMVIPLFVGREASVHALNAAMMSEDDSEKQVLTVAQKDPSHEQPSEADIYDVGTVVNVLQLLKLPDGTVKVLVEGVRRARIETLISRKDYVAALVRDVEVEGLPTERKTKVLLRSLMSQFEYYVKLNKKIPTEVLSALSHLKDMGRLSDTIAAHLSLNVEDKQKLLACMNIQKRAKQLMSFLEAEIDLMKVEKRIRGRVKKQMEKSQREYYLSEQMKAIRKELDDLGEGTNEIDELAKQIKASGMPKEARDKSLSELKKLRMMPGMSAEATVIRNYLDWMTNIPWKRRSTIRYDLEEAEDILNHDHYGLEKIKARIIEYLAVQKRVKRLRGPILCLVGPPGVGKTSLGKSIAHATGRKFIRISLGGVRDEAEIRGHRRTYIGSMPGKIIQKLAKVKVRNPLIMLDEVDKMAMDFRGDPASALLEVLDPEQNNAFSDHFIEVDYDLSEVMFIATTNSLEIPSPLLDRMEVIRLAGYTEDEKVNIAVRYLIPKQLERNGLKEDEVHVSEGAIREIIRYYTREAGVRDLDRNIAKIFRKIVKSLVSQEDAVSEQKTTSKAKTEAKTKTKTKTKQGKQGQILLAQRTVQKYLEVRKFRYGLAEEHDQIGCVTGLAWTQVGGELLTIEASVMPGKGKATYTGKLGEVMQESIQAAVDSSKKPS